MTEKEKLNINIWGFDSGVVEKAVLKIMERITQLKKTKLNNLRFSGPFPLPTKIRKISIPTSPFKHKESSGEQFEKRTHRRLIQIVNPPAIILDYFRNLSISDNVGISIKVIGSVAN